MSVNFKMPWLPQRLGSSNPPPATSGPVRKVASDHLSELLHDSLILSLEALNLICLLPHHGDLPFLSLILGSCSIYICLVIGFWHLYRLIKKSMGDKDHQSLNTQISNLIKALEQTPNTGQSFKAHPHRSAFSPTRPHLLPQVYAS
jgi:hypothetical protein